MLRIKILKLIIMSLMIYVTFLIQQYVGDLAAIVVLSNVISLLFVNSWLKKLNKNIIKVHKNLIKNQQDIFKVVKKGE